MVIQLKCESELSDSVGPEWGSKICFSNTSTVDAAMLVCAPHFEDHWSRGPLDNIFPSALEIPLLIIGPVAETSLGLGQIKCES